jgi:hypothetical protein
MIEKIRATHLARKAILYVRQSSAYQVTHNLESPKLQYAMQERLRSLGWREIEVIDEDLGCSAAGTVTRSGFERMVAEVCLRKAGAGAVLPEAFPPAGRVLPSSVRRLLQHGLSRLRKLLKPLRATASSTG